MIYSDVLKGGSSGKCVESGDVDSLLVKCVTHEEEPIMPPKGPKLSDKEIDARKVCWHPPLKKYQTGVLAKYACLARPASQGAHTMPID